jgi:HEAT repeat protein
MSTESKDTRSIAELFAAAFDWSIDDGDGDWKAVWALHDIGGSEVLEMALALLDSPDPRVRARVANILGQLGIPDRSHPEECFTAVAKLIRQDTDPLVLESAAIALGHLKDPRGVPELVRVAGNPDPEVRHAVAFALGGHKEPDAVSTLIHLMRDEEAHVRDWATFGLGEINSVDTPEIREALFNRLNDDDEDTRYEAVRGLVRCRDLRAVPALIEGLRQGRMDFWLPAETMLGLDHEGEQLTTEELIARLNALVA